MTSPLDLDQGKTLVPSYIQSLRPYQAGRPIEAVAREKGLTKISKLASNENPLGPSPFAIRQMTQALWDVHRYPDMHAYDLKQALSKLYNLGPENIILGNGSEGIMSYIMRAFVRPDDVILTSESTFIGMYILAKSVGAKLIKTPLTSEYKYDTKAMAKKIGPSTKIIYIANPNNPTGTYIKKDEFDELMTHVPPHVLVILDEAYFEFAQAKKDYPDSMTYRYDNVITLRTFSKAYGLGGIRVGYGFGHPSLIENLTKIKLPFEPSLIAQKGALGALEDRPHLKRTLEINERQYQETFEFLSSHKMMPVPSVTNFILFKTGSEEASDWLYNALLNQGVILRPMKVNEMPSYMRVSLGTEEEMEHFQSSFKTIFPEFKSLYQK